MNTSKFFNVMSSVFIFLSIWYSIDKEYSQAACQLLMAIFCQLYSINNKRGN